MGYPTLETAKRDPLAGPIKPGVERHDISATLVFPFAANERFVPNTTLGAVVALPLPQDVQTRPVDELLSQLSQGYRSDFRRFRDWCDDGGYKSLPAEPETLAFYLADHAGFAVASLRRWLVGISMMHKEAGVPSPTTHLSVRDTLKGIRREAKEQGREPRQSLPLLLDSMRLLVAGMATGTDASLLDLRDRAMLLVAWACAMRASEVGTIRVGDLRETPKGYIVTLRKSKTNQTGEPQPIGMPLAKVGNEDVCPVLALRAWVAAMHSLRSAATPNEVATGEKRTLHSPRTATVATRPVFCGINRHGGAARSFGTNQPTGITPHSVNRVIRARARAAGFSEDVIECLTCHSLRAGFATAAALGKAVNANIMKQGRWNDARTLQRYIRDAELFDDNAATSAGL